MCAAKRPQPARVFKRKAVHRRAARGKRSAIPVRPLHRHPEVEAVADIAADLYHRRRKSSHPRSTEFKILWNRQSVKMQRGDHSAPDEGPGPEGSPSTRLLGPRRPV